MPIPRSINLLYHKVPDSNGWIHGVIADKGDNDIISFPNYCINENGDVYSLNTNSILVKQVSAKGYLFYRLSKDGIPYTCYIHRLVALNFLPKTTEDIELNRNYVNHKDSNPLNNHVSNLEWCTFAENNRYAFINGAKTDMDYSWFKPALIYMLQKGMSLDEVYDIFKETGINRSTINHWAHDNGIFYRNFIRGELRERIKTMALEGKRPCEIKEILDAEGINLSYHGINNVTREVIKLGNRYDEYIKDMLKDIESGMSRNEVFIKYNKICGVSYSGFRKIMRRYGVTQKINNDKKELEDKVIYELKSGKITGR